MAGIRQLSLRTLVSVAIRCFRNEFCEVSIVLFNGYWTFCAMNKMALSQEQRTEIPAASSFSKARKSGTLRKLTRRGWLYPGSWKSRYCVLDGTKLYFYENEQSRGTERTSGVLNLDYFDVCDEGKQKDKRVSNVFVISTSVRGIFDLQTRHFFAADTLPEMNDWIQRIRLAITDARNNRSRAGRAKGNSNQQLNAGSDKSGSLRGSGTRKSSAEDRLTKSASPEPQVGSDTSSPDNRLYTPTKNRPKGPQGRRLPQRKSMLPPSKDADVEMDEGDGPQRARSMSALECITEGDTTDNSWLTSPLEDLSTCEGRSASQNALVYKYSSSEESLELPEEGRVKQLSKMLKIPTSHKKPPPLSVPTNDANKREQTDGTGMSSPSSPGIRSPNYNQRHPKSPASPSGPEQSPRFPRTHKNSYENNNNNNNSPVLIFTRQLNSLDTKVHGLEQEMVVTRSDLATVHGGLGKVQAEVERLVLRIERISTQVNQVEKQMSGLLNDAQKYYEDAEKSSREAQEARQEFVRLKIECQETLKLLQAKTETKNQ